MSDTICNCLLKRFKILFSKLLFSGKSVTCPHHRTKSETQDERIDNAHNETNNTMNSSSSTSIASFQNFAYWIGLCVTIMAGLLGLYFYTSKQL